MGCSWIWSWIRGDDSQGTKLGLGKACDGRERERAGRERERAGREKERKSYWIGG